MPIKPPAWARNAIPTIRGWESPEGELLVSGKHTQDQIDEFNGIPTVTEIKEVDPQPEEAVLLNEAPIGNVALNSMTKAQLEALGEEKGLNLTEKETKKSLIKKLKSIF